MRNKRVELVLTVGPGAHVAAKVVVLASENTKKLSQKKVSSNYTVAATESATATL